MPLCSMNSESEPRAASSCGVLVSKRPELRASAPTGRVCETNIRKRNMTTESWERMRQTWKRMRQS